MNVSQANGRKKILLLNPPGDRLYLRDGYCASSSKAHYYWAPIDLLVLSGILSQKHDIQVLDANVLGLSQNEAFKRIEKMDLDAVVFITSSPSWKTDFEFVAKIKEKKGVKTIASGGFLLFLGEKFMRGNPFLDAIILEYTGQEILEYLSGRKGKIQNMIVREGGNILVGKKNSSKTFEIPVPRHDLFPISKYRLPFAKRLPVTTVIASQGCPFSCTFCIGSLVGFRDRPNENTIEELRFIKKQGIKEIFFKDFTFTLNRSKIMDLCNRMTEEKFGFTWSCLTRVHLIDDELLETMKKAGCHTLLLGVETGNEELLKKYSKGINREQIKKGFDLCKKHGITTLAHFIIGLPGETEKTARETIDLAIELDPDYASFNIALPLVGSPLREEAIKNNWCSIDTEQFDGSVSEPTMETPLFSKEDAKRMRNTAIKEFYLRPKYMARMVSRLRSLDQTKILFHEGLSLVKNVFF